MFETIRFFQNFGISYKEKVSSGWDNINCPYCPDTMKKMGINREKAYCSCFKCGYHWLPDLVAKITETDIITAKKTIEKYTTDKYQIKEKTKDVTPKRLILPNINRLNSKCKKYLLSKKYDPERLEKDWLLMTSDNKLFIPIYFKNKLISYQTRDIYKKSYKSCDANKESFPHKNMLYGIDKTSLKTVIVVEGVSDVWRLGFGAVCTFGINCSKSQLLLLAHNFQKIFIFYDSPSPKNEEIQSQERAFSLYAKLSTLNKDCEILNSDYGDPGEMTQKEADYLMQDLKIRI